MPVAGLPGADVYFEERGSSERCVVFSHGFLMDHEMFEPQVAALAESFRCVAWDERGHGATPARAPFTYWDSAHDLLGLLDHLGVESAALVGMSQGGFLSLRAALLAPERVAGLAFIDSQAGPEDEAARPIYEALFQEWLAHGMSDAIAQAVAAAIVSPADAAPWIEKWRTLRTDDVRHSFAALVEREDLHDRLGEISCPVMVVHGTADPSISLDLARALCEGLSGCDGVTEVEGGGHASNMSHPDQVTAALGAFLDRVWPG